MPAFIYLLLPIFFWSGQLHLGRLTVSDGMTLFSISFLTLEVLPASIILPFCLLKSMWREREIIAKETGLYWFFLAWLGIL